MEIPPNEKASASPSLPPSSTQISKRGHRLRKVLTVLSLGFLLHSTYTLISSLDVIPDVLGKSKPRCAQAKILVPKKNGALWESLSATLGTDLFIAKAVDWIGGAVRVPTESFDDMGAIGEDPRWTAFAPFHDYLRAAFPLVHSTLTLTKVNTYGLLYIWQGSDASLKPLVLTGHQDVVPVNPSTVDQWTHPPYSGYFDGTWVWGRGSADDKSGVIGSLVSVETLIAKGFQPTRTLVLAFGFDEEVGGRQGAQKLASVLFDIYGKDGVAMVVDEGGGFVETNGIVFATPGIAEKGYLDVRVEVTTPGGHSSVPPTHTSIGILSALLVHYEANPHKVELTRNVPLYNTLQCIAEHGKNVPKHLRRAIRRSWSSKNYLYKLQREILKNPVYNSLVGTTQAIDVIEGGVKVNALPETAWAIVNHRISVTSSVREVQTHNTKLLKALAKRFHLKYTAFGTNVTTEETLHAPSHGSLTLSDAFDSALEPATVTPTGADAVPYRLLSGTIKATYSSHRGLQGADGIIVGPGMSSGNTDARYYSAVSKHIFRYNHSTKTMGAHTVNEALNFDSFIEKIRFFATLILNVDEARF